MAKIAFVWWFDKALEIYPYYRDGLRSAIEGIGLTHDVDVYLGQEEVPPDDYDAYLLWDDANSSFFAHMGTYRGKKGIILTTNPHNIENLKMLDIVFCESQTVYDEVRSHGLHAVKAFGTDTDFFSPLDTVEKTITYFYPATFSPWKQQAKIANLGKDLYCVGTLQPDGLSELEACQANGVNVAVGYFRVEYIRDLYRKAKMVPIPAIHGSERTVLEAMSMDILPEVNPENKKAHSYIDEYHEWYKLNHSSPREFVLENYSHHKYAKDILKGFDYA